MTERRSIGNICSLAIAILLVTECPAGLVAWYPLDTDPLDHSGNGHHGNVAGGTVEFDQPGASGNSGRSAAFPDGGRIDVPFSPALNAGSFTVTLWANPDPLSGSHASPITSRDDFDLGASTHGYLLYINPAGRWDFWTGDGDTGWDSLTGAGVSPREWVHIAITYDAASDTKSLYLNGSLSASDNVPQSGPTQYSPNGTVESENLHIGSGGDLGNEFSFAGQIDDVTIWDEALGADQIDQLRIRGVTPYRAGDANRDGRFDSGDLVTVFIQALYNTGEAASWGDGDWNGAPGGVIGGTPPTGDGLFDQFDFIAAFYDPTYERGPYGSFPLPPQAPPTFEIPLQPGGNETDQIISLRYTGRTGRLQIEIPVGVALTTAEFHSTSSAFTGIRPTSLDGVFDVNSTEHLFKFDPSGMAGTIDLELALAPLLTEAEILDGLRFAGTFAAGGAVSEIDLIFDATPYRAGDANLDGQFNSSDLVTVFVQALYNTGEAASWGDGDWNGAPGGVIGGTPPTGDGLFDQFDLIAAFYDPTYERGPYESIPLPPAPPPPPYQPLGGGAVGDGRPSLVYDYISGQLTLVADGVEFSTLNVRHTEGAWIAPRPADLDGIFDIATGRDLFKLAPSGFGDLSFGATLPPGLDASALRRSLEVIGTGLVGGAIEDIDLLCLLPNDQFAGALDLGDARSATGGGKNTDASLDPGEPLLDPGAGGHTIWWSWTAPEDGMVSIDTSGSNFDTILAVFTGDAVGALNQIALDAGGKSTGGHTVTLGAGVGTLALAGAINLLDTASDGNSDQSRQNIDLSFTQTLPAGTYRATTWSYNAGQSGSVTPYLAYRLTDNPSAYEVVATGTQLHVLDRFGTDVVTGFGGDDTFTLNRPAEIFAGIANPKLAGSQNPISTNLASGSQVDHDTNADGNLSEAFVGGTVDGFGHPNLSRSYAFSIGLDPIATSRVTFFATAGTTYRIVVDGFAGADPTGLVALHIRPQLRITDITLLGPPGADGSHDVQITWISEPDQLYSMQLSSDLTDWYEKDFFRASGNISTAVASGIIQRRIFVRITPKSIVPRIE